jgi:hypothetical protein
VGRARTLARALLGVGAGLAGAYGAYAAAAWYRYGHLPATHDRAAHDPLLDAFVPAYEVADRRQITVATSAAVALAAACEANLADSPLARGLFAARAFALRAPQSPLPGGGLRRQFEAMGWSVLAEEPDREIVFGTVTRPWEGQVVFRPIPAAQFTAFDEPYCVKIAFMLRADPLGPDRARLHTETRVATTDARARRMFRRYWAAISPGVALIRLSLLRRAKAAAERAESNARS